MFRCCCWLNVTSVCKVNISLVRLQSSHIPQQRQKHTACCERSLFFLGAVQFLPRTTENNSLEYTLLGVMMFCVSQAAALISILWAKNKVITTRMIGDRLPGLYLVGFVSHSFRNGGRVSWAGSLCIGIQSTQRWRVYIQRRWVDGEGDCRRTTECHRGGIRSR